MQMRSILAILFCAITLASCSVSRPNCSTQDISCQYEWYMFEADRIPPNYTRSHILLSLDINLRRLPSLFQETSSRKSSTLAMSYLLRDLYRLRGPIICRRPEFHQMASEIRNRIKWRLRRKSIERNLEDIDCVRIS